MVRLVNLNRKLKTPADKAVFQGKNPANKTTGPNTAGGLQDPWRGTLDTNPLNDDFYQSSYTFSDQASGVQQKLDGLQFEYGNAFEEGNNQFAAKEPEEQKAANIETIVKRAKTNPTSHGFHNENPPFCSLC